MVIFMAEEKKRKSKAELQLERDNQRKQLIWSRINRVVEYVREVGEAHISEIVAQTGVPASFIARFRDVIEEAFEDIMYDIDGNFYVRPEYRKKEV